MRNPGGAGFLLLPLLAPGCLFMPVCAHPDILLIPRIEYEPTDVSTGQPVRFHIPDHPYIQAQTWEFGDSVSTDGADPVHVYEKPGVYTVSITTYFDSDRCPRHENGGNSTRVAVHPA